MSKRKLTMTKKATQYFYILSNKITCKDIPSSMKMVKLFEPIESIVEEFDSKIGDWNDEIAELAEKMEIKKQKIKMAGNADDMLVGGDDYNTQIKSIIDLQKELGKEIVTFEIDSKILDWGSERIKEIIKKSKGKDKQGNEFEGARGIYENKMIAEIFTAIEESEFIPDESEKVEEAKTE